MNGPPVVHGGDHAADLQVGVREHLDVVDRLEKLPDAAMTERLALEGYEDLFWRRSTR